MVPERVKSPSLVNQACRGSGRCRGELAGARAAAEEALAVATAVGDGPYRWRALAILGSARLAAGDAAAANGFFARLREQLADGYPGPVRSEGDEIEAVLALGRVAEAERALDRLVPGPGRWAWPWQTVIEARGRAPHHTRPDAFAPPTDLRTRQRSHRRAASDPRSRPNSSSRMMSRSHFAADGRGIGAEHDVASVIGGRDKLNAKPGAWTS